MVDRLKDKVAIIVGAGQQTGDTIGNGRAISILFAREGAKVMLVDKNIDSANETKSMIDKEGVNLSRLKLTLLMRIIVVK